MPTIGISGASGLVGQALQARLRELGWDIRRLVRRAARSSEEIRAECETGEIDTAALNGLDAVVHLAGESIASGRSGTAARKARIRDSRVVATRRLCAALAGLEQPPKVLIAASAIGYYGDRGEERLTESAALGVGFLADVCQAWEAASQPAADARIRVVNLRTGMVLSRQGGALAKMLTPFRFGLGGKVGSGRQYWSWIELSDLVAVIVYALENAQLSGPVNAVSPQPSTNLEFTRTLGRVLRRPTIFPLPGLAAKLMLGEMANELLLASQRVFPEKLLAGGYQFRKPELEPALRAALD